MAMSGFALREHSTVSDIEGGEERRGAVSDVVVRDAFDVSESHGQHGLRAPEGHRGATGAVTVRNGVVRFSIRHTQDHLRSAR